jgi:2-polyprenyl-3-methyl-5-hydroxy-6-metoxy-1,4-benzoquinol methylase
MQANYEREYVEAEQSNAWFVKRKELVYSLLASFSRRSAILEIGCGSGYILDHLQKNGFMNVSGVDSSKNFLKYYKNIKKSTKLIVQKNKYDLILLLDVIEHVRKEETLLKKIYAMLKQDGILIISAPAYGFLWSHHDDLNKHYRRYTKSSLNVILNKNNFLIKRSTYWNSIMLPPIFLIKQIEKMLNIKKSNIESTPTWFNGIYKLILSVENIFVRSGVSLPFGLSIFTVAKKHNP